MNKNFELWLDESGDFENQHEEIEVEIHQGDQPVYPYLMSVE